MHRFFPALRVVTRPETSSQNESYGSESSIELGDKTPSTPMELQQSPSSRYSVGSETRPEEEEENFEAEPSDEAGGTASDAFAGCRSCIAYTIRYLQNMWFHYFYPAAFFAAALMRRGTVVCFFYVLAAASLNIGAALSSTSMPRSWRVTHAILFFGSAVIFLVASILDVFNAFGELPASLTFPLGIIGCGGLGSHSNGIPGWPVSEGIAFGAATIGWMCGSYDAQVVVRRSRALSGLSYLSGDSRNDVVVPASFALPELPESIITLMPHVRETSFQIRQVTALAILLVFCATLDCNAFSSLYYSTALVLLCSFAWRGHQKSPFLGIKAFRCFVVFVTLSHSVTVIICGYVAKWYDTSNKDREKEEYVVVLGAVDQCRTIFQTLCAFVLLEILVFMPGFKQSPESILAERSLGRLASDGHVQNGSYSSEPACDRPERHSASFTSEVGDSEGDAVLHAPTPSVPDSGMGSFPLENVTESRTAPLLATLDVIDAPLSTDFAEPTDSILNQPIPPQPTVVASSTNRSRPTFTISGFGIGSAIPEAVVTTAQALARFFIVPFVSMWLWGLMWPALPTIPLLLLWLALLHFPLKEIPVWIMHGSLAYQVLYSVAVYNYNVYCNAVNAPRSLVPSKYTWLERGGLINYAHGGWNLNLSRICFVCIQAVAVFLLAVHNRCRADKKLLDEVNAEDDIERRAKFKQMTTAMMYYILGPMRVFTVVSVLVLVLAPPAGESTPVATLFGLVYMCWIVSLVVSGSITGKKEGVWDGLYGHDILWKLLLNYSGGIVILLSCWEIIATYEVEMVGLVRTQSALESSCWGHAFIACCAAVQARRSRTIAYAEALERDEQLGFLCVQQGLMKQFRDLCEAFVKNFGIFAQMSLMFAYVFMDPFSIDTFLMLLLFIAMMAIEQFCEQERYWRYQITLLRVVMVFCGILLPLRYAVLIKEFQEWLTNTLPDSAPWGELLDVKTNGLSYTKVWLLSCLFVCNGCMTRIYKQILQREQSGNGASHFDYLPSHPVLVQAILVSTASSTVVCLFISYFFMTDNNCYARGQTIVLMGVLFFCRYWRRAGAIVSVTAMALLVLQYVSRFHFLSQEIGNFREWVEYVGCQCDQSHVGNSVVLMIFGLIHNWLHRARDALRERDGSVTSVLETSPMMIRVRREIMRNGVQVGGITLLAVVVFDRTAFSTLNTVIVIYFVLHRRSQQKFKEREANRWLLAMSIVVAIGLLYGWGMQLWFPPNTIDRISSKDISLSALCAPFNDALNVNVTGKHCSATGTSACETQRARCGEAMAIWLGVDIKKGDNTACFVVFFFLCSLRKACWTLVQNKRQHWAGVLQDSYRVQQDATSGTVAQEEEEASFRSQGTTFQASFRSQGTTVLAEQKGDVENAPLGQSLLLEHQSSMDGVRRGPSFEPPSSMDIVSAASELPELPQQPEQPLSQSWRSDGDVDWSIRYADNCTLAGLWMSLAMAFLQRADTDAVGIANMLLLFLHARSVENASGDNSHSRKRALSWIRKFNIFSFGVTLLFQCPTVPCTAKLPLEATSKGNTVATFFSTPAQCASIQSWFGLEQKGTVQGWQNALSVVMQSIGFRKIPIAIGFNSTLFWYLLVFTLGVAQAIIHNRWDRALVQEYCARKERIEEREKWYIAYLKKWRKSEIDRIDTKEGVLKEKLDDLGSRMDKLRLFWSSCGEEAIQEAKSPGLRKKTGAAWVDHDRVMNLSLQSGFHKDVIEHYLLKFADDLSQEGCEGLNNHDYELLKKIERQNVDLAVILFLEEQQSLLLHNRKSSYCVALKEVKQSPEAEETKKELVGRFRKEIKREARTAGIILADDDEEQVITDSESEEFPLGHESAQEPKETRNSESTLSIPLRQYDTDNSMSRSTSQRKTCRKKMKAIRKTLNKWMASLESSIRNACFSVMDDLLFVNPTDEVWESHRKDNSVRLLLAKALVSQTTFFLITVCMLKFMFYQSILSMINVVVVMLSLMSFPHSPQILWRALQVYNLIVIIVKMLYQLPIFCINGSISISGCELPKETPKFSEYSLQAVLGLLKIKDQNTEFYNDEKGRILLFSSLFSSLWCDLLVCALLFIHWHVLWYGGRLRYPKEVCEVLRKKDDQQTSEASVERSSSTSPNITTISSAQSSSIEQNSATAPNGSGSPTRSRANSVVVREQKSACQRILLKLRDFMIGSSDMRKPAKDFYTRRVLLAICCLFYLVLGWSAMSGSSRTLSYAVSNSKFSGSQVIVIVLFLFMIVIDRALYTSMYQDVTLTFRNPFAKPRRAGQSGSNVLQADDVLVVVSSRVLSTIVQKILLFAQLIALHGICISQWSSADHQPTMDELKMTNNKAMLGFYLLYMTFLGLTSCQLKYHVHLTRGGLGLTHKQDLLTRLTYKVYCVIPFMEEIRVLTDWTVTKTSLDFFMWMKLEDAQQSLYTTKCDMDLRELIKPADPQPIADKICMGCCLNVLLLMLIVGPLMFFSTLNGLYENNLLSAGTLMVSLQVKTADTQRRAVLYQADYLTNAQLEGPDADSFFLEHREYAKDACTVQRLVFPISSDMFWLISPELRKNFAALLENNTAQIRFSLNAQTNGTSATYDTPNPVDLSHEQKANLIGMFNESESNARMEPIELQGAFSDMLHLDATNPVMTSTSQTKVINLTVSGTDSTLSFWTISQPFDSSTGKNQVSFLVVSDKKLPNVGTSSSSTFTVWGIYFTVVYTIGRLLRLAFNGASKRIIYEELPDTELLLDLCNGIYIARMNGKLRVEYELYYNLIRIYRSPETLFTVSKDHRRFRDADENVTQDSHVADVRQGELRRRVPTRESAGNML